VLYGHCGPLQLKTHMHKQKKKAACIPPQSSRLLGRKDPIGERVGRTCKEGRKRGMHKKKWYVTAHAKQIPCLFLFCIAFFCLLNKRQAGDWQESACTIGIGAFLFRLHFSQFCATLYHISLHKTKYTCRQAAYEKHKCVLLLFLSFCRPASFLFSLLFASCFLSCKDEWEWLQVAECRPNLQRDEGNEGDAEEQKNRKTEKKVRVGSLQPSSDTCSKVQQQCMNAMGALQLTLDALYERM
jgi:hypothetical protein